MQGRPGGDPRVVDDGVERREPLDEQHVVPVEDAELHVMAHDNFERMLGYAPTFGLVSVDRETFARTPKPSLAWLGEVARRNGLA
jgi:hypothetical protein